MCLRVRIRVDLSVLVCQYVGAYACERVCGWLFGVGLCEGRWVENIKQCIARYRA